ncbi:hypothetical protein [Salinigranum marinum]|uniref:hypothetical protein n=1 Tax=Salinigranum marinum TaxID=1515595 RepID=UPI002989B58A|nr:hypothetical protein [Salinigranum marinum]
MFRRLRKNGPIVLVPLAWSFVTAAHLGYVSPRTLLAAHVVMNVVFVVFTAASWSEMRSGVLYAWKLVLLVGFGFTAAGTVALAVAPTATDLVAIMLAAWMLVPAAAFVYTARNVAEAPGVYRAAAALSVLGWAVYFGSPLVSLGGPATIAGLTLVNVGQTAGIANAVVQY